MPEHLTEEDIQGLYSWIDEIPLTRPKKSITRDFSDGEKVFKRLHYSITEEIMDCIVNNKPGYIEYLLYELRIKIQKYIQHRKEKGSVHDLHVPEKKPSSHREFHYSQKQEPKVRKEAYQPQPQFSVYNPQGLVYPPLSMNGQPLHGSQTSLTGHDRHSMALPSNMTNHDRHSMPMPQPYPAYNQPQYGMGFPSPSPTLPTKYDHPQPPMPHMYPAQISPRASISLLNKQNQGSNRNLNQGYPPFSPQLIQQVDKDQIIEEMQETISILQLKISKLEQLLKLKDKRVDDLSSRLRNIGLL